MPATPDFAASFRGLDYWVWEDAASGERLSGAQSHTWDTAFAVQAICDGPVRAAPAADQTDFAAFLRSASRYLQQAQIRDEAPHRRRMYRDRTGAGSASAKRITAGRSATARAKR